MRTLVLNAGYEPLAVVSFERGVALVMNHETTIDHSIPRSHGRQDSWENLVACCASTGLLRRAAEVVFSRILPTWEVAA